MFETREGKYSYFHRSFRGSGGFPAERYLVLGKKEGMKNVNMSICTSLTSFNSPRKIFLRFCHDLHTKNRAGRS